MGPFPPFHFFLLPFCPVPQVGHSVKEFQGGLCQDRIPAYALRLGHLAYILYPTPAVRKSASAWFILVCNSVRFLGSFIFRSSRLE